jgi:hypothetical protein
MRENPKSKKNAGRRTQWDAKKGKTVQKAGRPKALKAGNPELMRLTKDQLVRKGTPAAKAELARRARKSGGQKMAWSAAPAKRKSTRRARHNPAPQGRLFIRIPTKIPLTASAFETLVPNVIYYVGPGKDLDKKSNLVVAAWDFRMGPFGAKEVMRSVETVRSEDEAMEKLRKASYPRNKIDRYDGPYNLYQVEHTGGAFELPTLVSESPFLKDVELKVKRKADPSVKQVPAHPYPYPLKSERKKEEDLSVPKYMSYEQLVMNEVYSSGRDMSVPWRKAEEADDGMGGRRRMFSRRTIVTKYFGEPKLHCQEAAITEGVPGKGYVGAFTSQEIERGLAGISLTLTRENPGINPALIEYCVLPEVNFGDVRIQMVLWKSVKSKWKNEDTVREARAAGAKCYQGYPPKEGARVLSNPHYEMVSGITRRNVSALMNPMDDEDEFDFEEEEILSNPRRRRSHRR